MEELTVRLLPYEVGDGPHNMAADEVLLNTAVRGQACLRFYEWERATLSLGYFQVEAERRLHPLLAELPFVRRCTGGGAIVHHHELTYCLAVPSSQPWKEGRGWLRMHEIIAAALADFGVRAAPYVPSEGAMMDHFLCFHHWTAGDLMIGWAKVVGSAQRKQRGAVMQHGSVLLERSRFADLLCGVGDFGGTQIEPQALASHIVEHLEDSLGWTVQPAHWSAEERGEIDELVRDRYATDEWNRKR